MPIQFGNPPAKSLSKVAREQIADILCIPESALQLLFRDFEAVMTARSPEAAPLINPEKLATVRADLSRFRAAADAFESSFQQMDKETLLRILFGSLLSRGDEPPIGDFRARVRQFRGLIEDIDTGIAPPAGGKAKSDHLRLIAYECALRYHTHIGKWPAKRTGGKFHRVMVVVLSEINLELPVDPKNILKPAIDLAMERLLHPRN